VADLLYSVELRDGNTRMVCWVNKEVSIGNRITLKNSDEPGRWWTVTWIGAENVSKSDITGKAWKVGGL
jgi:hypothetical protein